jgi:hypothetical protein
MTKTEDVLPLLVFAAVAGFAASTFLHAPATPQKQKPRNKRAKIKDLQELRKLKEDFIKAEQDEAAGVDEAEAGIVEDPDETGIVDETGETAR